MRLEFSDRNSGPLFAILEEEVQIAFNPKVIECFQKVDWFNEPIELILTMALFSIEDRTYYIQAIYVTDSQYDGNM